MIWAKPDKTGQNRIFLEIRFETKPSISSGFREITPHSQNPVSVKYTRLMTRRRTFRRTESWQSC